MPKSFLSVSSLISETMVFFYAVARGRNPGVYATWEECKAEVNRYPHSIYKKFPSKFEAENFVATQGSASFEVKQTHGIRVSNELPNKSMETGLGIAARIKSPSDEIEKRLKNWTKDKQSLSQFDVQSKASKGANELSIENSNRYGGWLKYRLKRNPETDTLFRIKNFSGELGDNAENQNANVMKRLPSSESKTSTLTATEISIPGRIKLLEDTLHSAHEELHEIKRNLSTNTFQESSILLKNRKRKKLDGAEEREAFGTLSDRKKKSNTRSGFNVEGEGFVNVYTDGACSGNGELRTAAGIGVWFGDNHPLNVLRPVADRCHATNNLAAIQAVTEAARLATKNGVKKLKINTDSQFLISCITQWMPKWKKNKWREADGEHVINKTELIEMEAALKPLTIAWNHVRGHSGVYGNEMADRSGRAGAAAQSKK